MFFEQEWFWVSATIIVCVISTIIILLIIFLGKIKISGRIKGNIIDISGNTEICKPNNYMCISRDTFCARISEVYRLGKNSVVYRGLILREQMQYTERVIHVLMNDIIEYVMKFLELETDKYKQFSDYYDIVERVLKNEIREIFKSNHLREHDDYGKYISEQQKYLFAIADEKAAYSYHANIENIGRDEYQKKCRNEIQRLHNEAIEDIFKNALLIAEKYNEKYFLECERLKMIKNLNIAEVNDK